MASRKPSGTDSDETQLRPYLIKPFDNVAGDLQRRFTQGQELLTDLHRSALPVPERLEHYGAKYWDWHDDNRGFLQRVFSSSEIEHRYADVAIEKSAEQAGFADLLRDLALALQRDIGFLIRLHEGLRAYENSAAR